MRKSNITRATILLVLCLVMTVSFVGCHWLDFELELPEPPLSPEQDHADSPDRDDDYEEKLEEIISILDEYLVDGYDPENLGDYLAQAVIASTGDRWSYYISAEEYESYVEDNNNEYVGIGITIQHVSEEDPGFTIVSVTANSPAYEAGLKNGDMLTHVEGQSVLELGMDGAKNVVRGEENTDVKITVLRDGTPMDFVITRRVIEVEVVKFEMLENNIGYIHIANFDGYCAERTLEAIEKLTDEGAQSLIFDLRFNPGGRLTELITILDHLLPEGVLFRSVDYSGKEEIEYSDENYLDIPMAVLVNEDSYSAAEFFAAALQEYEWATVVGTATTGKANYQQTFRLRDGSAIAISTGHYQTPNGVTLEGVGVTPDITVEVDMDTYLAIYYGELAHEDDPQLLAAIDAFDQ